jgi:hypothetical protein
MSVRPVIVSAVVLVQLVIASAARADSGVFFAAPVNLSQNSAGTLPFGLRSAVDSRGNIYALWADQTCLQVFPYTCTTRLLFRRSVDGGLTFSAPRDIWKQSAYPASGPQLAVDAHGNINIVWEGTDSAGWEIFFSRSVDGGTTFSLPKVISNRAGSAADPQLAVDPAGHIDVVWESFEDYPFSNVWFSRSADGGRSFSQPNPLCGSAEVCNWPRIAVESTGAVDVVWGKAACADCAYDVFFCRSADGSGPLSDAQNLSNSAESMITSPKLVVDTRGNINVVWSKGDYWTTGDADVFFSRSTDEGTTFTGTNVSRNQGLSFLPQTVVDSRGHVDVFWFDSALGGIGFSRSLNGVDFSVPTNVSTPPSSGELDDPFVAMAGDDAINLVWSEAGTGIMFRRSTGGGSFSAPENISNNASVAYPQVGVDASGNINALWFGETPAGASDYFYRRGVTVAALEAAVRRLPASALKNKGHRRSILNALADVGEALASGDRTSAAATLDDLLWHLNGCGPTADHNDWIVDCSQQLKLQTSIQIIVDGLRGR